jgi:hypothetical protein
MNGYYGIQCIPPTKKKRKVGHKKTKKPRNVWAKQKKVDKDDEDYEEEKDDKEDNDEDAEAEDEDDEEVPEDGGVRCV